MLREAIRVVKLKSALAKISDPDREFLEQSPELLFTRMQDVIGSIELGHFPGDRELFFQLYHAGKDLDLLEYGLQTLRQDRAIGAMQVYGGIFARFLSEAVGDGTGRILVAEAEKFLEGLSAYRNQRESSFHLTLLTENYLLGRLLKIVFDGSEGIEVIQGSLYHPLPLNEKFQAILTVPAFGAKLEDDSLQYRDSELAAVHHLSPLLSRGGTLAAVMPARIMFQSGEMENWRRSIEEEMPVRAIYTLPEGLFRPYTAIKTYLLLLGGGEIGKEVRIGQLAVDNEKLVDRQTIGLGSAAFHELKDWRIELVLEQDGSTLAAFQQSAVPKIKLKAAADIFRGKSILKQDLRPGTVSVLNISNLDDGEVLLDQLETIDEEERKLKRYQVQEGDLVLTCRGTQTKLALFPASDSFVIASANIIVIRFNEQIDSLYAKIFLESPVGLALIQSFQRGTTVMNLNPSDVGEIEIPLLSIKRQREIGEQYRLEKQRYREAVDEATVRWEKQKNELYEAVLIDPHKEDKRLYGNG
ncbi:N-6 DNA methylase [Saccharibacillus sp. VR-M41]|uniref:N-6 DNA methylase n=2 Tax=Saccharibacillus alkalitolerans TaxID=2705290 RepID=A0ABX0F343_9BACL|nr:N-6 DNA methylase [Saccharibacillus alkalitolerans]